jgi:hypothetical protein
MGSGCPQILKIGAVNFRRRLPRQGPVEVVDEGLTLLLGLEVLAWNELDGLRF